MTDANVALDGEGSARGRKTGEQLRSGILSRREGRAMSARVHLLVSHGKEAFCGVLAQSVGRGMYKGQGHTIDWRRITCAKCRASIRYLMRREREGHPYRYWPVVLGNPSNREPDPTAAGRSAR